MNSDANSPSLLQAVQYMLANPEDLQRSTQELLARLQKKHPGMSKQELQYLAAAKIISDASYLCAGIGAVTALPASVPVAGTAIAMLGGGLADTGLSLKFQVEMTMKLAVVYEHDLLSEDVQLLCLLLTGFGTLQEAAKAGIKVTGAKALTTVLRENLKGALLRAVRTVFAKIGLTISRKSVEKAIPGVVGVVVGFSVNKAMTHFLGGRIRDSFASDALPDGFVFG